MGNAVDIVKFQVFFKPSIYCVTLNPGVTLRPLSLRQGVTDHFTIAALVRLEGSCLCRDVSQIVKRTKPGCICFSSKGV